TAGPPALVRRVRARAVRRTPRPAIVAARLARYRSGRYRRLRNHAGRPRADARGHGVARAADPQVRPFTLAPRTLRHSDASTTAARTMRPNTSPSIRLDWRDLAPFDCAIIGPEQARRHPAPRAPNLSKRPHFFAGRPLPQSHRVSHGLLQGEIAGRPGVGMANAEQ